jgi:type I restriction enzyme S subunit
MGSELPVRWEAELLENCVSAIIDYRGKSPRKTSAGVPLITAKIVKDGRIEPPTEFIADADYDAWMRRGLPDSGDVLITTEAPLGEVAQLDDTQVALAQRLILLRGDPGRLQNDYLKYALQSSFVQSQLKARSTGTTVLGIRQSELRKVVLPLPPLGEQRRIADTLGALDDKIELSRRMNRTLESIARAIFQSWFVDFDPVRKKMEGGEVGLPSDLATLFPESLEESAIGFVPRGWPVVPLSSLVHVNPKYQLARGSLTPYVEMSGLPTDGARVTQRRLREFTTGTRFRNGDVLVARITPCLENGKTALVDFLDSDVTAWGSTEFLVLRPHELIPSEYIYCLSRSNAFRDYAVGSMNGSSGRQRVPVEALERLPIVQPPDGLLRAFGHVAHSAVAFMAENDRQSESLAELRDCLLPKLLSGEISM